ncbi:AAA family ATPase [Fibrobacter sp. UWB12]|uniref:AAA family ATPase n=1 Tax=Fibrobacter sp. UWB12 TaxID=1896203 RepID=UPI000918DD45|nr:AAA family ATPase [Fibrobacter sp. UWB12]SHK26787.1 Predicted ATPase [Fibrobacter sp. UWB12]
MKLNVENFGKIKFASVELNGYSIFVGDNNSGKTYLMQLIYGVVDALDHIQDFDSPVFNDYPFRIDASNIKDIQSSVNKWLYENKQKIVKNIFNENLMIGSLSLELDLDDIGEKFFEIRKNQLNEIERIQKKVRYSKNIDKGTSDSFICIENNDFVYVAAKEGERSKSFWIDFLVGLTMQRLMYKQGSRSLFLPASRSGLNLVYKNLFAELARPISFDLDESKAQPLESKKLGLTGPVFDYLSFMQTYKFDAGSFERNKELIDFIDKKIIHGTINRIGEEIRFRTQDGMDLPLYLASSMVNELSPLVHVLSSVDLFGRIFYDEIETSQHPTTQIQLARLMNRLVNSGVNVIVSTHSDTMAAAISNLVTMSFSENSVSIAEKLGYESDDLLKEDCVHAYQFIKDVEGRTVVTEVEKFINLGIGYDFSLFNETNDKLYSDYLAITGKNA